MVRPLAIVGFTRFRWFFAKTSRVRLAPCRKASDVVSRSGAGSQAAPEPCRCLPRFEGELRVAAPGSQSGRCQALTASLQLDPHGRLRRRNRVLPVVHRDLISRIARESSHVCRASSHNFRGVRVREFVQVVPERHDKRFPVGIDRSQLSREHAVTLRSISRLR